MMSDLLQSRGSCLRKYCLTGVLVFGFGLASTSEASVLSDAAASLGPGQSVRITTVGLRDAVNLEGSNFIQWGNTGGWDPLRKRAVWIGKRHSTYPYHRLEYDEATNSWSSAGDLHPDLMVAQSGHGYDGVAVDPVTGDIYFRPYNSKAVYHWTAATDSWTKLPEAPGCYQVAEVIEWWPGRGLVFSDVCGVRLWDGGAWSTIADDAAVSSIGYHSFGEYQPAADVYVFGGGNDGPTRLYRLDRDDTLTLLGPAPIALGNGANTQGILVQDPSSGEFIAWDQGSTWYALDPITDTWRDLSVAVGDGASPSDGTPNFAESVSIAIPVPDYGVILFLGAFSDDLWIYRHSAQTTGSGSGNSSPDPPQLPAAPSSPGGVRLLDP